MAEKTFGVLAPSTNTMVEPDFYMMGVPGVTAHISRIYMANTSRDRESVESTDQRQSRLEEEMKPTIERILTAEPDYMVMGMSAPTFRHGVEGNRRWKARMQEHSGGLRARPQRIRSQAHRRSNLILGKHQQPRHQVFQ